MFSQQNVNSLHVAWASKCYTSRSAAGENIQGQYHEYSSTITWFLIILLSVLSLNRN